ncbi:MAG: 4-alpha-glucanotransferase [Gammaproteobacteria bacterium]|jgi:4-alpha-glucanotransferase
MSESPDHPTTPNSILHQRRAGVIAHPTSLPGKFTLGDLGPQAYRFVDFMQACGLTIWQVLPVGPTHEDNSPYMGLSVDAGNPQLISLEMLVQWQWLPAKALKNPQDIKDKTPYLKQAYEGFIASAGKQERREFEQFANNSASWLEDYALFDVLRRHFAHQSWHQWPEDLRHHEAGAIAQAKNQFRDAIDQVCFEQFVFYRQWALLKQYANERHIHILGDMPIFVAHDSAEVWENQQYFDLHEDGSPRTVAGVPPDYFSETGQRWGNPLYRWDKMAQDNFSWWIERFRVAFTLYDAVRVDHFRGFEAYWEIDAGEETAINGRWVKAPGERLFNTLLDTFDELPIVVEDLGTITDEVEALRDKYGWPGMKILQFAFDSDDTNPYLPHNHIENCVVYTGTHDNDTTLSWYEALPDETKRAINDYLGNPEQPMPWALIECAFRSVANWAIVPIQDLLSLGKGHRMNTPGVTEGNWQWRFQWDQVPDYLSDKVKELVIEFERDV